MRTFRGQNGPFLERPHFTDSEIDGMCEEALQKVDLLPNSAQPIRIERFIEKHFGVVPIYEELPSGVLGFTTFCGKGVRSMHIARSLVDDTSTSSERRLNSTLAHEAGHGLMHAYLFAFDGAGLSLFGKDKDITGSQVLCRDTDYGHRGRYDGRWWELQANRAIGGFLLPRPLLGSVLQQFFTDSGDGGKLTIAEEDRERAAQALAEIFNVNPAVARLRLTTLFPFAGF